MATGCGWTVVTAPAGALTLVPPPDNCSHGGAGILDFSEEETATMLVALLDDL